MAGDSVREWFTEPPISDETWAHRRESSFEWFTRSTLPRAAAGRQFLNRNLTALPETAQLVLYSALRSRWQSSFFELVVARTLQLLGATLIVEPLGRDGTRIDFVAKFPDAAVGVEAISPIFDASIGEAINVRGPLLDIVEALVPPGWGAMVLNLPEIGPNQSKAPFREMLARLMSSLPLPVGDSPIDLAANLPEGTICLRMWPGDFSTQPILIEPPLTSWNNSEDRIRWAVSRKKRQARGVAVPSLVAIHGAGVSTRFEDFDIALFGRTFERIDQSLAVVERGLRTDGAFAGTRQEAPVFAGALTFIRVGFRPFSDPVLYLHPRFEGTLPRSLLTLERRYLSPDRRAILIEPSRSPGFLDEIGFVPELV